MGNYVSNPAWAAQWRSDKIDRQIDEDSKQFRKELKILLLGSGESGKSTIVRQMKIFRQNGLSRDELMTYRPTIYKNTVDSARAIVLAMRELKLDCVLPANRANADRILDYRVEGTSIFTVEIAQAIHDLWTDPIISEIMNHSSEFYLMDSASYFFGEVLRIGAPLYVPTESDVLRVHQKTTGITELRFNTGQLSIHLLDVGGQRSERKKWLHCFESVTSIIFCTALSEYDQVLLEEKNQAGGSLSRMAESLLLFESVVNSRWFLRKSIILFLNKINVFKAKLPKVPLERYFPEYTGGADINKAAKYILWRFMQANRARLRVYPHITQATDITNSRPLFAAVSTAVKETILQRALEGMLTL
ncbi:guanine nucleotide binding protein, alpha subunit [Leucogyrophana mollusca]|uniref:Guanine nucleotide binding protein, alpha subunit n=1 Tax=Leucogyrophana mollusca TaxID=85980 RepID=A0ACB8B4J4_9AGAM|nr:guanine nucleotide binding protein, alpha subunit [Leucogyrophana mollusca]